jgi:hypothetical protein
MSGWDTADHCQAMKDTEGDQFLQWCLPRLQLCWPGYRKVRRRGLQAHPATASSPGSSISRRLSDLSGDPSRGMGGPGLLLLDPHLALLPRQERVPLLGTRNRAAPGSTNIREWGRHPAMLEPRLRVRGRTLQPLAPLETETPSPISDRSAPHPCDRH